MREEGLACLEVREPGHEQVGVLLRQGRHRQEQLREQALCFYGGGGDSVGEGGMREQLGLSHTAHTPSHRAT